MQKIVAIVFLAAFLVGCSTFPPPPARNVSEIVYIVDTQKTADVAFDMTMLWLNSTFVSAKNVIQYANKESGMITSKAMEQVGMYYSVRSFEIYIVYTLTVQFKDGKTRLAFNAVNQQYGNYEESTVIPVSQEHYPIFVASTEKLKDNYVTYMQQGVSSW